MPPFDRKKIEKAMRAYDEYCESGKRKHRDKFKRQVREGGTDYWVRSTWRRSERRFYPTMPILQFYGESVNGGWKKERHDAARLHNSGFIIVDKDKMPRADYEKHDHLIRGAERIRLCAVNYYIEPARDRGDKEVSICVSDLAQDMGLKNAFSDIYEALGSKELQKLANVPAPQVEERMTPANEAISGIGITHRKDGQRIEGRAAEQQTTKPPATLLRYISSLQPGHPGPGKDSVFEFWQYYEVGQTLLYAKLTAGLTPNDPRYWEKRGYLKLAHPTQEQVEAAVAAWEADGKVAGPKLRKLAVNLPAATGGSTVFTYQLTGTTKEDKAKMSTTNLILYGPPGTGKTYETAWEAVRLCLGPEDYDRLELEDDNQLRDAANRDKLMAEYRRLIDEEQIEFVTFHQSFSYEEFVEGLRPTTEPTTSGGFSLKPRDGIFKAISERAERTWRDTGEAPRQRNRKGINLEPKKTVYACRKETKRALLVDLLSRQQGATLAELIEGMSGGKTPWKKATVQSGLYWDMNSVKGYGIRTEMRDGDNVDAYHLTYPKGMSGPLPHTPGKPDIATDRFDTEETGTERPYVLIIDEINRANISRVFGELITLLETDKRLGCENELRVRLPYSEDCFGVPPNLHIIGTMNTADRSIALLDTALRRRFDFRELMPDASVLKVVDGIDLDKLLTTINERIEYEFDREHQIGHAYFIGCQSRDDVERVMRGKVIPLLAEYFYEDWSKVAAVLGDGAESPDPCFLEAKELRPPVGLSGESGDEYPDDRKWRWQVMEEFDFSEFETAASETIQADNVGEFANELIREGKIDEEVLEAVNAEFPDKNTKITSIRWYRSKLRKKDKKIPTNRELKKKLAEQEPDT